MKYLNVNKSPDYIYILKIVYFFEIFWLCISALNGYFIFNNYKFPLNLSMGAFVRSFLFILFIFISYSRRFIILNFILSIFITLTFIHIFFLAYNKGSIGDIVASLQMVSKLLLPIQFFFIVSDQIKYQVINSKSFKKIVYFNSIIILVNIFSSLFGLGFSQYGLNREGFILGGTGFIHAGNEVSATLLILYTLNLLLNFTSVWRIIFITLIFLFGSLLLLSKTAIFGLVIIFFITFFLRTGFLKSFKYLIIIFLIFTIISPFFSNYLENAINRWSYFADTYGNLMYFLGGIKRFSTIQEFLGQIDKSPFLLFSGIGWVGECENNFFDVLQGFGIFGLLIYFLWFLFIRNEMKRYFISKTPQSQIIIFVLLLLLVISYFAGHILQSATLAPFIALFSNYSKNHINEKLT